MILNSFKKTDYQTNYNQQNQLIHPSLKINQSLT